jgi:hypothetical protein
MPLYHCRKCHHEWEWTEEAPCDWCGADQPILLEKETPLEKLCEELFGEKSKTEENYK